ncbi:MAG: UDP-N-acetylglucosamine--N-acetylmuramyl-(pentapeptide) pyrophosphoryl-undecaprenol N-acetylglucosamine transferase [Kiritimatiellia bacterium]
MRFIIACGGTGGHVFPGVATGAVLQQAGHEAVLWLAGQAIERKTIRGWSGPVEIIPMDWDLTPSPRFFFRTLPSLARSFFLCLYRLRKTRPGALLAMGSRASIIPVAAARLLGIPVVLHEANVMPGRAIDWLSKRFRVTVAVNFPETAEWLPGRATLVTGFPLRDMAPQGPLPGLPPGPAPAVLVMGGSQASEKVNALACDALIRLHRSGFPIRVIHLAGAQQEAQIRAAYQQAGVPHAVFGFLHEMGAAYAGAAAAISRAGAASCAELALFGVPALFIPYPFAGNHQRLNALAMEKAGAALTRAQDSLTVDGLAERLRELLGNRAALAAMGQAARRAATPDAARRLADLLLQTAGNRAAP